MPVNLVEDGYTVPARADLPVLESAEITQVREHTAEEFVHGAHLSVVSGELWCSFGQNAGPENTATECALLRTSADGGRTWSEDRTIAAPEPEFGVSHGVLMHERGGRVSYLLGTVIGGMKDITTQRYVWDEGSWSGPEWIADGFWPLQEPVRLDSGRLAMAGVWKSDNLPYLPAAAAPPAVLISPEQTGAVWRMVVPYVDTEHSYWGESGLLVDGDHLLLVARSSPECGVLLAAESSDGGLSWSATTPTDLPFASSKPHIGRLSTGEPYLVGTSFDGVSSERSVLTISLGRPGSRRFGVTRAIRFCEQEGLPDAADSGALSYPHALEHNGVLYVAYSNDGGRGHNLNSVEIATIAVETLSKVAQSEI